MRLVLLTNEVSDLDPKAVKSCVLPTLKLGGDALNYVMLKKRFLGATVVVVLLTVSCSYVAWLRLHARGFIQNYGALGNGLSAYFAALSEVPPKNRIAMGIIEMHISFAGVSTGASFLRVPLLSVQCLPRRLPRLDSGSARVRRPKRMAVSEEGPEGKPSSDLFHQRCWA